VRPNVYAYRAVSRPFDDVVHLLDSPAALLLEPATAVAGGPDVHVDVGDVAVDMTATRWITVSWRGRGGDNVLRVDAELAITPPAGPGESTHLFLAGSCNGVAQPAAEVFVAAFLDHMALLIEELIPVRPAVHHLVIQIVEDSYSTEWAMEDTPF
jgi:hypothetical protein